MPFSIQSIIGINSQFTGDSKEQPNDPGRLRDILIDPIRDRIHVDLWPAEDGGVVSYFPPVQIEEADLGKIVTTWEQSLKTRLDAWQVFAQIAKLPPFQDGNKRTALISANHAIGALVSQEYLMPPVGRKYNQFMDALLGYYGVGLEGGPFSETEALGDFLSLIPAIEKS
ncbi:hypothetical protein RyT2_18940 [Pseudolactococcus yaeyamensis]